RIAAAAAGADAVWGALGGVRLREGGAGGALPARQRGAPDRRQRRGDTAAARRRIARGAGAASALAGKGARAETGAAVREKQPLPPTPSPKRRGGARTVVDWGCGTSPGPSGSPLRFGEGLGE